jgi:hypothetical protein
MPRINPTICRWLPGIAALFLMGSALASNSNKSIHLDAGTQSGGHSTVNGSITVGSNSVIDGSLQTVNGSIKVDADTRLEDAETVNGSIRLGPNVSAQDIESVNGTIHIAENVVIDGEVSVVNGKINVGAGSRVARDVSNVNGEMMVSGAEISGDMRTVNGDITLTDNAILHGRLTVDRPRGWNWGSGNSRKPRVIIGPGSQVNGGIRLEREVELFISDSAIVADVSGEMSLADAVRFSGARP